MGGLLGFVQAAMWGGLVDLLRKLSIQAEHHQDISAASSCGHGSDVGRWDVLRSGSSDSASMSQSITHLGVSKNQGPYDRPQKLGLLV